MTRFDKEQKIQWLDLVTRKWGNKIITTAKEWKPQGRFEVQGKLRIRWIDNFRSLWVGTGKR